MIKELRCHFTSSGLGISVVVLTKDSGRTIYDCLSRIQKNRPSEIIVVDGGSTDGTLKVCRSFTNKIYFDGGKGKSFARMLGAVSATQKYVAYVDSDILLQEKALSTMLDEITNSDGTAVSATFELKSKRSSYWDMMNELHDRYSKDMFKGPFLATSCSLIRKDVLLKYGFELGYGGGMDDRDLEHRLVRDKHRLYKSKVVAYHDKHEDFDSFVAYRVHLGEVWLGYLKKYGIAEMKSFPLLTAFFWTIFCIAHMKIRMIPYFVTVGFAETFGFIISSVGGSEPSVSKARRSRV